MVKLLFMLSIKHHPLTIHPVFTLSPLFCDKQMLMVDAPSPLKQSPNALLPTNRTNQRRRNQRRQLLPLMIIIVQILIIVLFHSFQKKIFEFVIVDVLVHNITVNVDCADVLLFHVLV